MMSERAMLLLIKVTLEKEKRVSLKLYSFFIRTFNFDGMFFYIRTKPYQSNPK